QRSEPQGYDLRLQVTEQHRAGVQISITSGGGLDTTVQNPTVAPSPLYCGWNLDSLANP
ncbi:hypothetical protein NPIL_293981, partial [Nephila pilipes]